MTRNRLDHARLDKGMFTARPVGDQLATPCWCERYVDLIPATDVIAGRTWCCGGLQCQRLANLTAETH